MNDREPTTVDDLELRDRRGTVPRRYHAAFDKGVLARAYGKPQDDCDFYYKSLDFQEQCRQAWTAMDKHLAHPPPESNASKSTKDRVVTITSWVLALTAVVMALVAILDNRQQRRSIDQQEKAISDQRNSTEKELKLLTEQLGLQKEQMDRQSENNILQLIEWIHACEGPGRSPTCTPRHTSQARGEAVRQFIERKRDHDEVNLSEANLSFVSLKGADLARVNLCKTDLRKANLEMAVLRGAVLREAVLREADLRTADLSSDGGHKTLLVKSDLSGANLLRAKFVGAILDEAVLRGANIYTTDFQGASLRNADLRDVKLLGKEDSPHNPFMWDVAGPKFNGAILDGALVGGADLSRTNLTQKQIHKTCGDENTILPEFPPDMRPGKNWPCPD